MRKYIEVKHKPNLLFPFEYAKDILKVLKVIDEEKDILKRVLSIKCFGNSKYFEKYIQHILVRIIKRYLLCNENIEEYTSEDVLLEVGISRYPEIIEFCGDLEISIENEKIEYKKQTKGSYINSYNVKELKCLQIKNAKKVIFIENKANYIDYILNKMQNDEFVVYHGGMYSPVKGEFFKRLYEAEKDLLYFHWSDIDIGGFCIFNRLRNIIPSLKPYKMDKVSLNEKRDSWQIMKKEYVERLKKMRCEKKYEIFFDVMDEMINKSCKLEQEAFI